MTSTHTDLFEYLRRSPVEAATFWRQLAPERWPELFELLAVAADLPRLADNRALADLPPDRWPRLTEVATDVVNLQRLVDTPVVPPEAQAAACHGPDGLETAAAELESAHCVTVDCLLELGRHRDLDRAVAALAETKMGTWGQLEREEAPELFGIFDEALAGDRFHRLTGYRAERDTYSLTLSLQDLDPAGIGWHRDLYWPREWVGEDVFAVLYGLGDDSPEKGGAFLYYVPWSPGLHACYRRHHQATVLWNSRDDEGRILHAVSGYHGEDTSRHLIILQCLRRGSV